MIRFAENIIYDETLDINYQQSVKSFIDMKISENSILEYDEWGRERKYTTVYNNFKFIYEIYYKYPYGHEAAWEPLRTEYKIEQNG